VEHASSDDRPRDPDWDAVPGDLQILGGLNHGVVVVTSDDGVSHDTLVIVPAMFGHEHRVTEDE
jgi:hypothetical protein